VDRLDAFKQYLEGSEGKLYSTSCCELTINATSLGLTLGAIIVVLSMAVDPFFQQLIQIDWKITYDNMTVARIPIARKYSKGFQFVNGRKSA
jgi:hypothetical protein